VLPNQELATDQGKKQQLILTGETKVWDHQLARGTPLLRRLL